MGKQKSGEADNIDDKNDVDDLEDDFRLLKKMKKGKHYVETDKAENALDYLKSNIVGMQAPAMETRIEELEKENNALRYRNKVLEEKKQSWKKRCKRHNAELKEEIEQIQKKF